MLICQQCRGDHFAPTFPYTSARARSDRIDTICGVEERGVEKQGMQPPSEGGGGKELEFVKSLLLAFCVAIAHVVKNTHTTNTTLLLQTGSRGLKMEEGNFRCPVLQRGKNRTQKLHTYPAVRHCFFLRPSLYYQRVCVCVSVAGKMCWFTIVMFDSSFNFPSTPHCVCVCVARFRNN